MNNGGGYINATIRDAAYRQSKVTVECDGRTSTGHILAYDEEFVTMLDHMTDLHRTVELIRVSRWSFDFS
ncbi:MAG: hypothetical protein LC650_03795 [Actinobacteria bacterium]|nr:hypothetical protein [Actinomycetota bacterium]